MYGNSLGILPMPGSFRVNELGAATYNIPLVVAPSGGSAPPVSLNCHSGHGGNGEAGVGMGEKLIEEIRYSRGNHAVKFVYQGRTDEKSGYAEGSAWERTKRLARVETHANRRVLRDYRITYKPTGGTVRESQVGEIRECSGTGSGAACHPPTRFDWANTGDVAYDDVNGVRVLHGPGHIAGTRDDLRTVDVNGDGLVQITLSSVPFGTIAKEG